MNAHLNDEQWAAAVLDQSDATAAVHLAECAACREDVRSLAAAAEAAREQARRAAERPEAFWSRQRDSIANRLAARDFVHPWRRWVWVAATVTLVLLASTLLPRKTVTPVQSSAQPDPDDALLLSVQQSIQSDVPQAMRPAALLAREMNRAATSRPNP